MDLTNLRYFVHVATVRNFAAGAKRAHISASAITKAIQKLEREVGVTLFERTTRRVTLTIAGEILLARGRDILAQVDAIPRELGDGGSRIGGDLRIAAMEVFSIHLLPTALTALVENHAAVKPLVYEMIPDQIERRLDEGVLDVGLTIGGGGARGIAYESLGESPGVIVCGRRHSLYKVGRVTRRNVAQYPFVAPRFFGREHLPSLDQFPESTYPRNVGATIELMQMGIELALGGLYLGYFPLISVSHHLHTGALRALRGLRLGAPFDLRMMTKAGYPPPASVTLLKEELKKALGELTLRYRRRN